MKELDIRHGELRTINGKNFVSWTDEEVQTFKEQMKQHDLSLVAAATPLFKWYVNTDDAEISHDSFGFNPRLSDAEKKAVIKRTIVIASELSIPRLRIFSGLGTATKDSAKEFASSPLLGYALRLADEYGVDLYIENEPVCRIHTKQAILELLNTNQHPRLKLWLDIANLLELGEKIDDAFITAVAPRLGYIHIKDFKDLATNKLYVPVGEGDIDYSSIISKIFNLCPDSDLIFTVETHAKKDKLRGSRISLINTASIIKSQEK